MSHVPISLGGRTYNLRFGAMGAYLLQKELGVGILEFSKRVDDNTLGFMELHALLWSELESSRKVEHTPPVPWSIESVGDIIDHECEGDLVEFWRQKHGPVVEAFKQSFQITMRQHEELQRRAAEASKTPDPPTEATSTGDTQSSGTIASTSPRASGSRRTRSGG